MTTVGLRAMKFPSGSAAISITVTATMTAIYMTARLSVMPTAVRIESSEKTMSSRMICVMALPKLSTAPPFLSSTPSPGVGSTLWWISLVAFQIRNRPPAIRIMSRQENSVSNVGAPWLSSGPFRPRSNTGWVRLTIHAIIDSSTRRIANARPMPIRRALGRCASGSLLVRMEMKTRLSIPSTTSITTSAISAARAVGSVKAAMRLSMILPNVSLWQRVETARAGYRSFVAA